MQPDDERELIRGIVDTIAEATGQPPRGWLGPALTETEHTLAILAEQGFTYTLDWVADDQPFPLALNGRRFISVPYSVEINDITAFLDHGMSPAEFGRRRGPLGAAACGERRRPGAVFGLALHPFLMNQPSRHRYLVEALKRIRGFDDVWFTTSDEVANWYLKHYYDAAVGSAIDAPRR